MILSLLLLALVAFTAWKTLLWWYANAARVARIGNLGVRCLLAGAYAAAAVALPVWAYLHPADERSLWIWAAYLIAPVLALIAFGVLLARRRDGALPLWL